MDVDAEDGRIYLPKRLREKFGHRFELVDRGDRLVLIPVAEDPLSARSSTTWTPPPRS